MPKVKQVTGFTFVGKTLVVGTTDLGNVYECVWCKARTVKPELGCQNPACTPGQVKCRHCGCTSGHACVGGCYWVLDDVCSNCAIPISKIKKAVEAYLNDPPNETCELIFKDKKGEVTTSFNVFDEKKN